MFSSHVRQMEKSYLPSNPTKNLIVYEETENMLSNMYICVHGYEGKGTDMEEILSGTAVLEKASQVPEVPCKNA